MKVLILETLSSGVGAFFLGFFKGLGNGVILGRVKRCVNTLFVVWRENGREQVADWSRVGRGTVARSENHAVRVKQKGWKSINAHHPFLFMRSFCTLVTVNLHVNLSCYLYVKCI